MALRGKGVSIGVEVSDACVRIAELEWAKVPRLRRLETYEIHGETGDTSSGADFEAWQAVWQKAFRPDGRRKSQVHVAVPNRWTVIRQLGLPSFGDEELRSVIEFQLQHSIHLPFDEVTFDFVRCPKEAAGEASDDAETSLILVAADKQLVGTLVDSFRHHGIRPVSVDIHPLAVYRLLRKFHDGLPQSFLFMEVNGDFVDMHVFHQGLLYLTRQFPLPAPVDDASNGMFDDLSQIGVEIERTVNFFRYTLNQRDVEFARLFIASPEGAVSSDLSVLEGQVGMPCEIMSLAALIRSHMAFTRKVAIRPDDASLHDYAAAIGLALRGV